MSFGVLVAAGAIVASSCGSAKPSALAIVTEAATKTTSGRTARYALTETTRAGAVSSVVHASGAMDLTTNTGSTAVDLDAAGQTIALHEILAGGAVYIDASSLKGLPGGLGAAAPPNVKWLKISGVGTSSAESASSGATQLQMLRAVSPTVTRVGTATIRGAKTTEYTAEIDPKLAASSAASKAKVGPTLQKLMDAGIKALGTKPVPVHVWIDSAGRLRRMEMTTKLTLPTGGSASEQLTFDYYDFGTPVHVTAPPASETYDVTSQLGGALSGLGAGSA